VGAWAMDDKAEIINRLTDMRDAIMRAVQYLEADELVKAWDVLQDQEQTNSLKGALDALEQILPEWPNAVVEQGQMRTAI